MRGPLDSLRRLDRGLMRRARGVDSPQLDSALVKITTAANYWRLWLAIAGLLALLGGRRGRAAAGRGVVALLIAGFATNGPAKLLARRRRPAPLGRPALIRMPRSTSFPSGHSAAAFAFATAATAELPLLAPVLAPLALAVGYSRVHTGVHYPSDVAAGAAIGIGSAALARRLGPQASPAAHGSYGSRDAQSSPGAADGDPPRAAPW